MQTSGWAMNNAHGVITRELWVRQDDETIRLREDHVEELGGWQQDFGHRPKSLSERDGA